MGGIPGFLDGGRIVSKEWEKGKGRQTHEYRWKWGETHLGAILDDWAPAAA